MPIEIFIDKDEIILRKYKENKADDVCEWKYTREIMDNAEFKIGCNQNALKGELFQITSHITISNIVHTAEKKDKGGGMMERLTNIGSNGEIWITDNDETRRFGRKETAYKKLAEYEDLEERGLLLRLPTEAYFIKDNIVRKGWVQELVYSPCRKLLLDIRYDDSSLDSYRGYLGNDVFLTQDEAEQKLKEMGSD